MYISIHPSMHPSIRPFVRPSTPLSIHDSHANALSCQIIQTALNEVDIRWDIWWIFDGYLFAFLLNSESSGRGAPTFAAKLGSVCADLGSLPDRLTACLLAANVPVKQLLSQKKQATSTCSANLSHTKLMLSLEIPWNFKCNSSISAFGKHGKILLISPDIWADAAVPEKTWPLTKAKVARARADRADRADAADAMARDLRHRSWLGLAEGPDRIRSALWCLCCIAMLDLEIQTYANHGSEKKHHRYSPIISHRHTFLVSFSAVDSTVGRSARDLVHLGFDSSGIGLVSGIHQWAFARERPGTWASAA